MDSVLWTWLADTLRAYPELAVFFALAVGFAVGPWKLGGFTLGNVTATLLAGVLIGQLGITVGRTDQVRLLPALPLCRRLRRRTAVLPRPRQRRAAPDRVFARGARALPRRSRALRDGGGPGRRVRGRPVCRLPDDLCRHRRLDRPDRPARPPAGTGQGLRRRRADRLCGDVSLRHDRIRDRARADRAEADWRRPAGRLRGVRATDGRRRRRRSIPARSPPIGRSSCAPIESTPAPRSSARRRASSFPGMRVYIERLRRGNALLDAHDDTVLCAGDVIAISGPRQVLVGEVERHVSEVYDPELLNLPATVVDVFVTNPAFNGKTLRAARRGAVRARRLPAQDHPPDGGAADPAGVGDPARRHPHARRRRQPRERRRGRARRRRPPARVHRPDDRRGRHPDRRADRRPQRELERRADRPVDVGRARSSPGCCSATCAPSGRPSAAFPRRPWC